MNEKRQLSEKEKEEILKRHGRVCFVDGEPITEEEQIDFHHIKPFTEGGPTNIDNMAPVCKRHHLTIGTMNLQEYRDKLELKGFFNDNNQAPKYLDDLIRYRGKTCGSKLKYEIEDNLVRIFLQDGRHDYPLHTCSATGWKYFYATFPVEYLENDKELQPRPLREKSMWDLYRHFQRYTQLAPSICRIDDRNILLLFDGQHKAAAQIWAGRQLIECKVYLNPESRELKETNLEAHGKFRQMSFYSIELTKKFYDMFHEDWDEYLDTDGEKSEIGFYEFLTHAKKKTKAQARNEIALAMYNSILEAPGNKISAFLSEKQRGRKQPLTFARLKKTFFQLLAPPPVPDEFESDTDHRNHEKNNLIRLMNIVVNEGLEGKWNPERDDASHKKATRIFSAGAIRAWVTLLRDVINQHLHHYTDEERRWFFYRYISDDEFKFFEGFVKKLFSNKLWDAPDPTGAIAARLAKDETETVNKLFKEWNLTPAWILGS